MNDANNNNINPNNDSLDPVRPLHTKGYPDAPNELAHYPVIHTQPIQWGEMDAFNHLNNVVYYRYAESARIAYLQELGMFDGSMVTVLAQSSCQYLLPVTYPDTLLLGVRCQRLGTTSIVIEYSYYSCAQQALVAIADAVIVRLDSDGKDKLPWTKEERARLFTLEEKVGHTPKY
ncbi:acyl-CoA thioesterase [Psychrobacter sp. CAL346-MNA-CIBAN-0220]|uniref:acyl-CoA thioesterase n=1 Tax=Psychrobacter sp. CAL346-MNA-CIBAN-0220 TaxID=3140457 RepID=UPI003331BFEE